MPIKTYTAKELPSGKAGGVVQPYAQPQPQMPINASSAKWDAMARLGGVVSRTANDFYKINQQLEESRQFAIAEHASNEFAQSLMKSQSEWEASKRFGDANPTAVDERATAIKEAKIELLEKYPDLNPNVRLALEKTVDSYIRRDYQESVNHVHSETKKVENDNIKATKARLILDVQNGMKSVGEAQILFAATVGKNHGNLAGIDLHFVDFEKAGRKRDYDLALQSALGAESRVAGLEIISNNKVLTVPERTNLMAMYERLLNAKEAKAKKDLENIREGERENWLPKIHHGTATENELRNTTWEVAEQQRMVEKLDTNNKNILAGKSVTTDPDTYDELSQMVLDAKADTEKKKTRDAVDNAYLGDKLEYGDAESLRGRTKEDDPLKTATSKRYHTLLKELETGNVFDAKDILRNQQIFSEKSIALAAYLKENPDVADTDIDKFYKELVSPEVEKTWGNILSEFLGYGETTPEENLFEFGDLGPETIPKPPKVENLTGKLVGHSKGKPVYELPNGTWQVGD